MYRCGAFSKKFFRFCDFSGYEVCPLLHQCRVLRETVSLQLQKLVMSSCLASLDSFEDRAFRKCFGVLGTLSVKLLPSSLPLQSLVRSANAGDVALLNVHCTHRSTVLRVAH